MRADTVFRFSTYLALGLAATGLAAADEAFLPGIRLFLVPVLALAAGAFVLEGRWSLGLLWSNLLGLCIAAGSAAWIAWNIVSPSNQWFRYAPYPVALLPFGAPLVMVLVLAKLFRSATFRDFWVLHALGLIQVALACVLAGGPIFGVWFFLYLVCSLWSLTLYATGLREAPAASLGRWWGLRDSLRRAVLVAGGGMVLFLATPRYAAPQWSVLGLPPGGLQTGYSNRIDLNYTGPVEVSEAVAFEVYVEDARQRPVLALNPGQRWRGSTLDYYRQGRWTHRHLDRDHPGQLNTVPVLLGGRDLLPDLGPEPLFFAFNLDLRRTRGLFLADPVTFAPSLGPPVRSRERAWVPSFHGRDATFLYPVGTPPRHYAYEQVALPLDEDAPRPAVELPPPYRHRLLQQPLPRVGAWTRAVLERLVRAGRLTAGELATGPDPDFDTVDALLPRNRERVARALTEYLSSSGAFTYRLEMRRQDFSVDAAEDFLCNVRQGYCEHFATGLTLMLRSVGIPARVVVGYRGAESQADQPDRQGWYAVRQSQAHSWVEALLSRPGPDGQTEFAWLTLDPTPGAAGAAGAAPGWGGWWRDALNAYGEAWQGLVVGYTWDKQVEMLAALGNRLSSAASAPAWPSGRFWVAPAALVGAVVVVLLARRAGRRRAANSSPLPQVPVDFYNRLLTLAARHLRLRPLAFQTPREFGEAVAEALRRGEVTSRLAHLPAAVVRLYYRVRYGNEPLSPAEETEVRRGLSELEAALGA